LASSLGESVRTTIFDLGALDDGVLPAAAVEVAAGDMVLMADDDGAAVGVDVDDEEV